jgi:peptidoglycan hydrolase-like protein with peptidoglycan-binding domain
VLLDRAHFSPGVIDGQEGSNLTLAISAFQEARRLTVDGKLSPAVWDALVADANPGPDRLRDHRRGRRRTVHARHPQGRLRGDGQAAGPRLRHAAGGPGREVPHGRAAAAGPQSRRRLLQGRNHDHRRGPGPEGLDGKVTRIEIDNAKGVLKAYADGDKLLAVYPATVGSTERPAPVGEWAVNTVAPRPTYTYDPTRLTFGKPTGKLTIKAGPNNPVGSTWIDLTKDTYGIHGTPDPEAGQQARLARLRAADQLGRGGAGRGGPEGGEGGVRPHQGRAGGGARPGHPPGSRAAQVGPGRPHGHALPRCAARPIAST